MPTKLPSGLVIYNATPHDLHFWCGENGVITAPSDGVLMAVPVKTVYAQKDGYELVDIRYKASERDIKFIKHIKKNYPKALIVASTLCSKVYPDVVAPIIVKSPVAREQTVSSNRFSKEMQNG